MKKLILIITFIGMYSLTFSQAKLAGIHQIANQFNSWYTYAGNHKLSDKLSIHTLYSHRRNDFAKYLQQSLVRVGLNYHVDKNLILTGGGDWIITYPYGEQPIAKTTTIYRTFEQLTLKNKVNRFYFKHRYKLEQQYVDLTDHYKTLHRFRYRFSLSVPLNKKTMEEKTIFLSLFNELFINLGKNVGNYYFNQNWAYIGVGYKINKKTSIQIGYMNQYFPKPDEIHIENNHTLSVSLGYSLDFTKKNTQ